MSPTSQEVAIIPANQGEAHASIFRTLEVLVNRLGQLDLCDPVIALRLFLRDRVVHGRRGSVTVDTEALRMLLESQEGIPETQSFDDELRNNILQEAWILIGRIRIFLRMIPQLPAAPVLPQPEPATCTPP